MYLEHNYHTVVELQVKGGQPWIAVNVAGTVSITVVGTYLYLGRKCINWSPSLNIVWHPWQGSAVYL